MKHSIRILVFILALLTALAVFACNTPPAGNVTPDSVAAEATSSPTPGFTEIPAIEDVIAAVTAVPMTPIPTPEPTPTP